MVDMAPCTIRQMEPAELDQCAALFERVGQAHFHWQPRHLYTRTVFLECAREEHVWVADVSGSIAGLLTYYEPEHFIHFLMIDAPMRGQGIARALLAATRNHYGRRHDLKVNMRNQDARAFYDRLGYIVTGAGHDIDTGDWFRLSSPG